MVMFTEKLSKQVEKAKKRNKTEAAKTAKKKPATKKKSATIKDIRNTNDREQKIIAAEVKDLQAKGLHETTVRELNEMRHGKPEKIVAVRHLIDAKTVSLVESDFKMIEQLRGSVVRHTAEALMEAAQIGELLFHIKSLMKFGEFRKWCKDHLPFCTKTATNYMKLHLYYEELLRNGVSSIVDAYAAIKGEAAPEEFIDEDDKTDFPKSKVEPTVSVDDVKLPKKKQPGPWKDLFINEATLSEMATWETNYCRKILVTLPIDEEAEKLVGKFIVACQRVLQLGGKLIFHHPAKKAIK